MYLNFQKEILYYQQSTIYYHIGGVGERVLFAFNGFANYAEELMPLFANCVQYKVVIIDLPGYSDWHKAVMDRKDLVGIITAFCTQLKITKFALFGYSLGAKICLNITEQIPEKIYNIILLAPDGLKHNFWYNIAVGNPLGKWIFKKITQQPKPFLYLVSFLEKMRIVNIAEKKLVFYNLQNEKLRNQLYGTWNMLFPLRHNISFTKKAIRKFNIPLSIIVGKKDYLFPQNVAYKFTKDINNAHVIEINSGHHCLKEKHYDALSKLIEKQLKQ